MLIGIAPHRARAAGIEPLVGGDVVEACADDRAERAEAGEHHPPAIVEPLILAQLQPRGQEIEARPGDRVIGGERQRLACADCGIEQIVGGVVAQHHRQADQRIILVALALLVVMHRGALEIEPGDQGELREQSALDAGEDLRAPAVIGVGGLLEQAGIGQQILVALEEIGLAEIERETELVLRHPGGGAQLLALAEEVAVLPEGLAAEAEIGVVGDAGADRVRRPLHQRQRHRHLAFGVGRVGVADAHRGEEAGLDQRLPRALDGAAVVRRALGPGDAALDEVAVDAVEAGDVGGAELCGGARLHGEAHAHRVRGDVDHRLAVGHLGEGAAVARILLDDLRLGIRHRRRARRRADLQPDRGGPACVQQRRRAAIGRAEADAGEMEERAGIDGHRHPRRLLREIDLVGQRRRPIARCVHDLGEPRQVVIDPAPEAGGARRRLVLERHQLRGGLDRLAELVIVEPLERDLGLVGLGRHGRARRRGEDESGDQPCQPAPALPHAQRGARRAATGLSWGMEIVNANRA